MKRYKFTQTVHVDGKKFDGDAIITEGDIPEGNLESCMRLGYLVELPAQPPAKPEKK